ncbi:MAG: sugar phosphate nucleotidyltransferase [Pyrinomonadaceae bacterium]
MKIESNIRSFQSLSERKANRLAVILAGGDGTRLRSLTRAIAGDERPKQFCPILGDETLLDKTRNRTAIGIAPENTYFSLTQKHEKYYERPLWNASESQMVVQPENRGTAPAILYSLMRLAKTSPDATVAFFPSDHYFSDDLSFMNHVNLAFRTVDTDPGSIVLLGIEPEKAETSYGWIEPVQSLFGDLSKAVSRVSRFWEKPTTGVAARLMTAGCLWNSFVMVGRVETFLQMFRKHLPDLFRMFAASSKLFGTHQESATIRSIYSWIDEINFSSEVLEKSAADLLVMRVGEVGWCDWGEPERVVGTLTNLGVQTEWMQALAA